MYSSPSGYHTSVCSWDLVPHPLQTPSHQLSAQRLAVRVSAWKSFTKRQACSLAQQEGSTPNAWTATLRAPQHHHSCQTALLQRTFQQRKMMMHKMNKAARLQRPEMRS